MTDLLLQPTGNPSQYEVVAGEQIVDRIALFSALRDRTLAQDRLTKRAIAADARRTDSSLRTRLRRLCAGRQKRIGAGERR